MPFGLRGLYRVLRNESGSMVNKARLAFPTDTITYKPFQKFPKHFYVHFLNKTHIHISELAQIQKKNDDLLVLRHKTHSC